jgi:hypothetical protein
MTENELNKDVEKALIAELKYLDAEKTRENMNRILEGVMDFIPKILNKDLFKNTTNLYSKEDIYIPIEYKDIVIAKKEEIPFN